MPGVGRENISIELSGRRLVISGLRVENAEIDYAAYHTIERVEGYFERSFNIPGPVDVEQAKARYVDGILDLYLPKSEEEPDRFPFCLSVQGAFETMFARMHRVQTLALRTRPDGSMIRNF